MATVAVETPKPSPFASSLMFGYVAQFLYEGDSPLAERRAAALSLDPTLLAELLGTTEGLSLAELLDPEALTRTEVELQHLDDPRKARDADELTDVLRGIGPLSTTELHRRSRAEPGVVDGWLADLVQARRVIELTGRGVSRWAVVEDAARVRDALGVPLPQGLPDALLAPGRRPAGRAAGPLRPHPRRVHRRRGRRLARASGLRSPATCCAGWSPPDAWSRAT